MKDKILKQIEEEALRRFPIQLQNNVDYNYENRCQFIYHCEWYHHNIKESVDVEMSKNIEIVLPSATSACKYDIQVKSMVGEVLFEHTFYGNSKPLIKESVNEQMLDALKRINDCSLSKQQREAMIENAILSASQNTVSNEGEKYESVEEIQSKYYNDLRDKFNPPKEK